MSGYYTTMDSPIGPLLLTSDGESVTGLWMDNRHDHAAGGAARDAAALRPVVQALEAYFAGETTGFDLPVRPSGTDFQRKVWAELLKIPYGRTASYGGIATDLGNPTASRAVGLANGRNPISVIIPCHRVIGADGSLTGYGGGLPRKRWLLDHERAVAARLGLIEAEPEPVEAGLW
jgi:methylated-DNA-[protein]-cysteine S-methyltransferase